MLMSASIAKSFKIPSKTVYFAAVTLKENLRLRFPFGFLSSCVEGSERGGAQTERTAPQRAVSLKVLLFKFGYPRT